MVDRPEFTAHNIRLPDGSETKSGTPLVEDTPQFVAALRSLRLLVPTRDGPAPRIADLGSLEGGYAVGFARAGYAVVAIEGREQNHDRAVWAAERLRLPNLELYCDDVRNLHQYGTFDAVFCGGLLYHLDNPVQMLRSIADVTSVLLLHTHFARRWWLSRVANSYSFLTTHEGARGRWCREFPRNATSEQIAAASFSSIDNRRSFWLEHDQLIETLGAVGFDAVYEQYDHLHGVPWDYRDRSHRGVFVAAKTGLPPGYTLWGGRPRMTTTRWPGWFVRRRPSAPREALGNARRRLAGLRQ